ncbi:Phospholipid methyltransferase [Cribrihabitans marinus]|uniref:Phospholipid methyltransferase n=1 Tax=Cribrihabitans marinus TaxID=1227549 RepID=A0A1H7DWB9_9RHOB|nr:PEMT/PEM2 methyltransferase family protein [Cribrihabitans marinus]GGH40489.1 hypothetical protein GCM10010973_36890 [Cribrihabitans marinus]SEK06036.1 Phospholipid methyltransferase [Cribrihabitans marinus]
MSRLQAIRARSSFADMLEGQPQHAGLALLLAIGALALLIEPPHAPRLLGLTAGAWATLSISLAILHQVLVAIVFRLQLHRNLMTRAFGDRDMRVWAALFLPLLIARPLTILLCGWADTVPITPYRGAEIAVGVVLLGVAIWALHSTLVHFTIRRALGGDHFRDEIAAMPLVDKGAFRYTSNAMYGVAFLGLWGIALLFGSWNALIAALFQHVYIWVHMYCTERPDMDWIYGNR